MRSPKIGLHDVDAPILEEGPHVALVGEHRLGFDQRARIAGAQDVEHDLVVFGGVLGPMDLCAVLDRVAFELLQIVAKMGQRVFLDRGRQRAQLFPFGQLLAHPIALFAQIPQPLVMKVDVVLRLDELGRGFRVVDAFHARAPFRICAIWMNLIGRPSRSAHPC